MKQPTAFVQPNPLAIVDKIKDASTILLLAQASFDIWWYFDNINSVQANRILLDRYAEFLVYNAESNLCAYVVRICNLIDGDKTTIGLGKLLTAARNENLLDNSCETKIRALLLTVESTAKKLKFLRDNVFAHKSGFWKFTEAYKNTQLSNDEMRKLSLAYLQALNELRKHRSFNLGTIDFRTNLLTDSMDQIVRMLAPDVVIP